MAIDRTERYPAATQFQSQEKGLVIYALAMRYLQNLNIEPNDTVGNLILKYVSQHCKNPKDFTLQFLHAFPLAITDNKLISDPFNLPPSSVWSNEKKDTNLQDYLIPTMKGGDIYTFEVARGAVNNLPVTVYKISHGPISMEFRSSNSNSQTTAQTTQRKFVEWERPLRIVARGIEGLHERRFAIATPS